MSDPKLRFETLLLRRELPSGNAEATPVAAPAIVSYGPAQRTLDELQLALSELPDESRPTSVARLLLPDGVRVVDVEVRVKRPALTGRLARATDVTVNVTLIPELRADGTTAGQWAFVPAIDHACFIGPKEDIATRIADELANLPAALDLDLDGWRRLLSWAPAELVPMEVELATTPLAQVKGARALATEERRRRAIATLDAAGRRVVAADTQPPLVGRDELLGDFSRLLGGDQRRSVLLVGEEAAGKSAIATAWAAGNSARMMWATSASELVAGASGLGEWQERAQAVVAAVEALDAVLYFDDFGALFSDLPEAGGIDLASALRRPVVDGRIRIVGELTPVALDRAERRDVSLIGAMLRITVPATNPALTVDVCHAWAAYWKVMQANRPQIAPEVVPLAVDLAKRFLPYRAFPGKAVRLLEELRVSHDSGRDEKGKGKVLGPSELYSAFSWSSGIPTALLADDQVLEQADVVTALRRRMIGQDAAVKRVAEAISVAKARLAPGDKPLASLLFVGPTGTGKTELARSVAAYLFGAPDRMVRLDMSEYTDAWAAERLFGGDGGEGRLTAAVRSQPFGVVLLDEIEKAHPSVWDLLLQVLGEARLTDARGRTTHFHNSIIVLTSNLGTRGARGTLGLSADPAKAEAEREERRYRDAIIAAFRPELINRLDQIVVFHPLTQPEILKIAEIAIRRLGERRGFTQAGVLLDVSAAAIESIAEHGFSPELGARALRRHVDAALLAPASRLLAKAGADGAGATLTVRAPGETTTRTVGSRIGAESAALDVALWRRSSTTGRRMVRSALALSGLRRQTDRDMGHRLVTTVAGKLAELRATLANIEKPATGRPVLSGKEIARLSTLYARLQDRYTRAHKLRTELQTAEELCLDALARDIDAVDLIDGAVAQRNQFRRELFWLMTALRPTRPGAMFLVHSPDARPAVSAYVKMIVDAAAAHGWPAFVHFFGEHGGNWPGNRPWGPPHDAEWVRQSLSASNAKTAALVRIMGTGADLLFGLEQGLHRFHGVAGEAAHVWVDLWEARAELKDPEWLALPNPPPPRPPRGEPMREVWVNGDRTLVRGEDIEIPWSELAPRLAESAVTRLIDAHIKNKAGDDNSDSLWVWERPLQEIEAQLAKAEKIARGEQVEDDEP
jgi:ATP-dependent Clp protease ATP-binding subunit ClpC